MKIKNSINIKNNKIIKYSINSYIQIFIPFFKYMLVVLILIKIIIIFFFVWFILIINRSTCPNSYFR